MKVGDKINFGGDVGYELLAITEGNRPIIAPLDTGEIEYHEWFYPNYDEAFMTTWNLIK